MGVYHTSVVVGVQVPGEADGVVLGDLPHHGHLHREVDGHQEALLAPLNKLQVHNNIKILFRHCKLYRKNFSLIKLGRTKFVERQSNILLKLFFQNCLLWSHLQRNNYIIQTTQQGLTFMFLNLSKTHLLVLYLDYIHPTVSMLQPLQRVPPHDLHPAELHRGATPQHPQVARVQTRLRQV